MRKLLLVFPLIFVAQLAEAQNYKYFREIDFPTPASTLTNITLSLCFNETLPNSAVCPTATGLNAVGGGAHVAYRSGFDIAFGSAGNSTCGTKTSWQIDNYNPTTGALQAQVLTTLSSGGGNKVFMCYGDTTSVSFKGGAIGANYDGSVQIAHPFGYLNNPANNTTDFGDYSGHSNNPTAASGISEVAGMMGGAANAAINSNGVVTSNVTNIGFTSGTISWWANSLDAFNDGNYHPWWGQFDNASQAIWAFKSSDGHIGVSFQDSTGASLVSVTATAGNFPQNAWAKYDFTWTVGGNGVFYVNGAAVATVGSWGHANNIGFPLNIFSLGSSGTSCTPNFCFDGAIDNFIVANTARSATWVSTQYNFESAPASNITVNAETTTGATGTGIPPCDTTVNGDRASLQNAYNTVPNGGVICINAGTFQWIDQSQVGIYTKFVEFRGAGFIPSTCPSSNGYISGGCGSAGSTILHMCGPTSTSPCTGTTGGTGLMFNGFQIWNGNVIIDNLEIRFDPHSSIDPESQGVIFVADGGGTGGQPWIVHHNNFFGVGGDFRDGMGAVACHGPTWTEFASSLGPVIGLVYRNHFNSVPSFYPQCDANPPFGDWNNTNIIAVATRVDPSIGVQQYQQAATYGNADDGTHNIYVETNVLEGFFSGSDFASSARIVERFNYMNSSQFGGHGYDSDSTGVRHVEIYNNKFACVPFSTTFAGTGGAIQLNNWGFLRSGTFKVHSNIWPSVNFGSNPPCASVGQGIVNMAMHLLRLENQGATTFGAFPGSYPGTYPIGGQYGWGWCTGSTYPCTGTHTISGASTQQMLPGNFGIQDGFQMDLEPMYSMNNVNATGLDVFNISAFYNSDSRLYTRSNVSNGVVGTTLVAQNYADIGQTAIVVFADRVGGATPTVANACVAGGGAQTWTPLAGSPFTANGVRLSAWYAKWAGINCGFNVTVTFGSSSAARAIAVSTIRGLTTGTPRLNPTMVASAASTVHNSPSITTSTNELVIGFQALADNINDSVLPGPNDTQAAASFVNGPTYLGIAGTATGSSDIVLGLVYQATDPVATITNQTTSTSSVAGVVGSVSFAVSGTTTVNSPLDLQVTDLVHSNSQLTGSSREGYQEVNDVSPCQTSATSPFNGTIGTGCGTRAFRPTTCTTGVGYWALDDSNNWNATSAGAGTLFMGTTYFNGAMDTCTATNTWTNATYVPATYPNVLANITSGGASQSFTAQPTNTASGSNFSPTVVVSVNPAAADSITLSVSSGSCTLSGTLTVSATAGGVATFTGVGVTSTPANNCVLKAHDNTNGSIADVLSNSFNSTGSLAFTAQPSNVVSGSNFSPTIVVTTTPSSTDNIQISVSSGTCTLSGTTTVAAVAGVATFTGVGGVTLGANCILLAHDTSNTAYIDNTSNSFNVTGTTTFSSQPTNTVNSHPFSPTITVTLAPASQTATDSVTLTVNSGTCTLTGTTTVTAVANVATFTALTANALGSNCVLRAHDNTHATVADILSNQFNITGTLFYSQQPTNTITGNPFSPTITVGTSPVKSGDNLTLTMSAGTCAIAGTPTAMTNTSGVATFSLITASATGTNCVLTVDDDASPLYTPFASNTFNITNPAPPVFSFSQQPGTIVTGATFSPAVAVTITPASADSITLFINACGTTLTGTTTLTASGGLATFTGMGASGPAAACSVRAHDNTNSAVLDVTSNTFNVTGAPPPVMSFSSPPTNLNSGSAFSPTVKIMFNNSGVTDTVTLSMNGCGSSLTGPTSQGAVASTVTYTGLGANGIAASCSIIAHDITNNAVVDITSPVFTVTGTPGATGQSNNIILQQGIR